MDQRHHPRFSVHFRSSFSSVNRVGGEGNVVDLSLRGYAAALTIQQAVVRWCRDGRIGIEFVSLQPDEWTRLQGIVKELTRQPYERANDRQDGPGTSRP